LTPKKLAKWEKTRDIPAEIVRGLKQMRAGRAAREHGFKLTASLVGVREKSRHS
jgi:hypothetical protein